MNGMDGQNQTQMMCNYKSYMAIVLVERYFERYFNRRKETVANKSK